MSLGKHKDFSSDVVLGERYRDDQTGTEGVATGIHFYQFGCERVTLEFIHPQQGLQEITFDAPRLTAVTTEQKVTTTRTGGPARAGETRGVPSR